MALVLRPLNLYESELGYQWSHTTRDSFLSLGFKFFNTLSLVKTKCLKLIKGIKRLVSSRSSLKTIAKKNISLINE